MKEIKDQSIQEIRKRAKEYITTVRGENISRADLLIAENLTAIGYQILQEELIEKKQERKRKKKEAKKLRRELLPGHKQVERI